MCCVLASCAAVLWGCGIERGAAYERSFNAARRAYNAGRYAEAAELYARAAGDAQRVKDRDEATFLEARMYEKLARWHHAQRTYDKLTEVSPDGPRSARASYERAYIEIDHGDAEAGWLALERALRRYPDHGSARRALSAWAEHVVRGQGEAALQAALERWIADPNKRELSQQLDYELAKSLWRTGALARAHTLFVQTARAHPYPKGTLTDDAYFQASRVAEELGEPTLAIADLRELLSAREVAEGGSYERPRYPAAQYRIGELYRDRVGDLGRARNAFRSTWKNHDTSILADDAMWHEARIAKQVGDASGACDLAEALRQRVPESRYARCLKTLCATAPASARPCPAYLLRD